MTHRLSIKGNLVPLICGRRKTLDIRVGYRNIKGIAKGDRISFVAFASSAEAEVDAVRAYATFADALEHENLDLLAPGFTTTETVGYLRKLYPPRKERLGVYVIEFHALPSST
jgi:ASC-1-like (ASCH) protein